jgi:hypothetical protein
LCRESAELDRREIEPDPFEPLRPARRVSLTGVLASRACQGCAPRFPGSCPRSSSESAGSGALLSMAAGADVGLRLNGETARVLKPSTFLPSEVPTCEPAAPMASQSRSALTEHQRLDRASSHSSANQNSTHSCLVHTPLFVNPGSCTTVLLVRKRGV